MNKNRYDHNIFIGISLSNKQLTKNSVKSILDISIDRYKANKVLFLIADEIDLINFRVFEDGSDKAGQKHIANRTREISSTIEQGIKSITNIEIPIIIDRWQSIMNQYYWNTYIKVFNIFSHSEEFRNDLENIAKKYSVRKRGKYDNEQLSYLSTYMLAELPTIISGIMHNQETYHTMIYPTRGGESIDKIASKIEKGYYLKDTEIERFCSVKKIMA